MYMTEAGLEKLLDASAQLVAAIEKRPRPGSLPVAVLRWRGVEINALTASGGLPPADVAMRSAREVTLETVPEPVLIADAGDLLRNKLTINRPKDASHIDILRHFMEEEAVAAFLTERESRARIAPTERLLAVVGARTLQASLGARLVAVAREPSDFRFLAHRLPSRDLVVALAARAPSTALRDLVEAIATRRNLT